MSIHAFRTIQKRSLVPLPMLLVFSMLLLIPGLSQAQTVFKSAHGEWEATIFGGGSFLGSSDHETYVEDTGEFRVVGLKYDSGYQIGGRITANRWQHWGAAGEYGYSDQAVTFTNISDDYPSLKLDHAIHRFSYNVIYYPYDRDSRLRPYVFGGPGASLYHISSQAKDVIRAQGISISDPWKFTMNWGAGLKYLFRSQVAASFQFSDSISGIPSYGLPNVGRYADESYIPGFSPSGLMHNWLISGGFLYQWDER